MNNIVMWLFLAPSVGSFIMIFLGAWFVRKDERKRTRWVTYSSLFFSFIFMMSPIFMIIIDLISFKKDFEIFLAFIMFGVTYLVLFLKGRLKYPEKFE